MYLYLWSKYGRYLSRRCRLSPGRERNCSKSIYTNLHDRHMSLRAGDDSVRDPLMHLISPGHSNDSTAIPRVSIASWNPVEPKTSLFGAEDSVFVLPVTSSSSHASAKAIKTSRMISSFLEAVGMGAGLLPGRKAILADVRRRSLTWSLARHFSSTAARRVSKCLLLNLAFMQFC